MLYNRSSNIYVVLTAGSSWTVFVALADSTSTRISLEAVLTVHQAHRFLLKQTQTNKITQYQSRIGLPFYTQRQQHCQFRYPLKFTVWLFVIRPAAVANKKRMSVVIIITLYFAKGKSRLN